MKVFCNRSDLNRALNNVGHAVPTRTTSNILEGILFEAYGEVLKLTATDTTITIESVIPADVEDSASFVLPAKLLTSIVSKLPEEEVMLDINEEQMKVNLVSGTSSTELVSFSADEFPKFMLSGGHNSVNIRKEDIKKLIRKTAFSASTDDFNGVLTGVLLEMADGNMKMVAVDPFRIATFNVDVDNSSSISVIIPAKLATDVSRIIADDGEEYMTIEIVDNKVVMIFDNNQVTVNTFNGKFIDYNRILGREGQINIRVKRQELLKSIDRASLLSSVKNNNLIKFTIKDSNINITSLSEEGRIDENVEIIKEGDDLVIGMNAKYLKDALSAIDDEEILINMKDQVSPCIIKPLKGDRYIYLVLPIRIN